MRSSLTATDHNQNWQLWRPPQNGNNKSNVPSPEGLRENRIAFKVCRWFLQTSTSITSEFYGKRNPKNFHQTKDFCPLNNLRLTQSSIWVLLLISIFWYDFNRIARNFTAFIHFLRKGNWYIFKWWFVQKSFTIRKAGREWDVLCRILNTFHRFYQKANYIPADIYRCIVRSDIVIMTIIKLLRRHNWGESTPTKSSRKSFSIQFV